MTENSIRFFDKKALHAQIEGCLDDSSDSKRKISFLLGSALTAPQGHIIKELEPKNLEEGCKIGRIKNILENQGVPSVNHTIFFSLWELIKQHKYFFDSKSEDGKKSLLLEHACSLYFIYHFIMMIDDHYIKDLHIYHCSSKKISIKNLVQYKMNIYLSREKLSNEKDYSSCYVVYLIEKELNLEKWGFFEKYCSLKTYLDNSDNKKDHAKVDLLKQLVELFNKVERILDKFYESNCKSGESKEEETYIFPLSILNNYILEASKEESRDTRKLEELKKEIDNYEFIAEKLQKEIIFYCLDQFFVSTHPRLQQNASGASNNSLTELYKEILQTINGMDGCRTYEKIMKMVVLQARYDFFEVYIKADKHHFLDNVCDFLENSDPNNWYTSETLDSIAKIIIRRSDTFDSIVFTTNFDPLLQIAFQKQGQAVATLALHQDWGIGSVRSGIHIVHLHGFWRQSSPITTDDRIRAERPELRQSLEKKLSTTTLLCMGYGGWPDIFLRTVESLLQNKDSDFKILWAFFEEDEEEIKNRYESLLDILKAGIETKKVFLYKGINLHDFFNKFGEFPYLHANTPALTLLDDKSTTRIQIADKQDLLKEGTEDPTRLSEIYFSVDVKNTFKNITQGNPHILLEPVLFEDLQHGVARLFSNSRHLIQRTTWADKDFGYKEFDRWLSAYLKKEKDKNKLEKLANELKDFYSVFTNHSIIAFEMDPTIKKKKGSEGFHDYFHVLITRDRSAYFEEKYSISSELKLSADIVTQDILSGSKDGTELNNLLKLMLERDFVYLLFDLIDKDTCHVKSFSASVVDYATSSNILKKDRSYPNDWSFLRKVKLEEAFRDTLILNKYDPVSPFASFFFENSVYNFGVVSILRYKENFKAYFKDLWEQSHNHEKTIEGWNTDFSFRFKKNFALARIPKDPQYFYSDNCRILQVDRYKNTGCSNLLYYTSDFVDKTNFLHPTSLYRINKFYSKFTY